VAEHRQLRLGKYQKAQTYRYKKNGKTSRKQQRVTLKKLFVGDPTGYY
jgi:hypothetical protein